MWRNVYGCVENCGVVRGTDTKCGQRVCGVMCKRRAGGVICGAEWRTKYDVRRGCGVMSKGCGVICVVWCKGRAFTVYGAWCNLRGVV